MKPPIPSPTDNDRESRQPRHTRKTLRMGIAFYGCLFLALMAYYYFG